ncbi:MAG TPA: ATP-binding cassette domain-containing protein, partial [Candidatus Macondimonas sp.]|nr:ATP-binding cassette domain-containing protein [Candidatus Macondimonas sp.]
MDHAPVVRIRGLVKNYKDVHAVRGLDLDVPKGSLFGLIGSDGAGKSSTMKTVAGVMSYDEGTVEVFGQHIDSEATAERVKLRLGFMPQGLGQNLYPDLSIEENIDFFARLRLVKADDLAERKEKLLRMTRLDKFRDRAMKNLSGGMKQKLGLVCTLIHEPELIILDEPTTGVDPVSRRDFWAILAELLAEKGISALVSTAYMDEASRFHHAALMHHGRILAHGEIEELIHLQPGTVVSVAVQPQLEALNRLRSRFEQVVALGNFLRVFVPA